MEDKFLFAVINNIPKDYRSSDLRNYFSQFIESNGFECFHFRHRPEEQRRLINNGFDDPSTSSQNSTNSHSKKKTTQCCVVKMKTSKFEQFVHMYDKHHWLDKRGNSISSLCHISKVKVVDDSPGAKYLTRKEMRTIPNERDDVTLHDLMNLPELNPPVNIMPNGNVGTKTQIFLDLIAQCKMPANVIAKLGLVFPKRRSNRRYGCVSLDYNVTGCPSNENKGHSSCDKATQEREDVISKNQIDSIDHDIESASGHTIYADSEFVIPGAIKKKPMASLSEDNKLKDEGESSEEDDDRCEEWERHEALHDDPADVERNKERLFEEEIELKWEKGGSGLVFYTDAQYWKQQEGDFDEQTADDWDVDMSCYYEENGGDKDSKDLVTMRQEKRRRNGEERTDMLTSGFLRKKKVKLGGNTNSVGEVGQFEQHTKGIGRKVLESQGWRDGEGLGGSVIGATSALENEGQTPADKRGIGYYGEKVARFAAPKPKRQLRDFVISTVYDNSEETDPAEPLLRRNHHHHIKHRNHSE